MLCNYNSQYKTIDAIFIIYLKQTENNHTNMQIISKMTKKFQIKKKKKCWNNCTHELLKLKFKLRMRSKWECRMRIAVLSSSFVVYPLHYPHHKSYLSRLAIPQLK